MAKIVLQRAWPDGDELTVMVKVTESFPDAVNEAKAAALDAYARALDVTLTSNEPEGDQ